MFNDPSGQRHRDLGKLDTGTVAQNSASGALLLRVIFFPFWLPVYLWKLRRRNREMSLLAAEMVHENPMVSAEDIALKWALDHKRDYRFGELDPKLPKLEQRFTKTMARQKRDRL